MLRRAFCEYMMGGEERIAAIKELLVELHTVHGCTLCVLTRGETASLRVVFDKVLPDWAPLFEGGWVANTANEYFTCDASGMLSEQMSGLTTGGASKENMLEQLFPFDSHTVLLVDDSISSGSSLVSSTTPGELGGGVIHLLDLPLEQRGLDGPSMAMLRQVVGGEGGLAELANAQKASAGKAELQTTRDVPVPPPPPPVVVTTPSPEGRGWNTDYCGMEQPSVVPPRGGAKAFCILLVFSLHNAWNCWVPTPLNISLG